MKSANDIYRQALKLVGAFGAGQSASAEDMSVARDMFRPLIAELSASGIATITVHATDDTVSNIADNLFPSLSQLLANEIAPHFGAPTDERQRMIAINRICKVVAVDYDETVMTTEYY